MDNRTDYEPVEPSHQRQFSTSLGENLDAVIESLQIIQFECDVVGDKLGARFLEGVAATVRAFALTHVPFGRRRYQGSRLQIRPGGFNGVT